MKIPKTNIVVVGIGEAVATIFAVIACLAAFLGVFSLIAILLPAWVAAFFVVFCVVALIAIDSCIDKSGV